MTNLFSSSQKTESSSQRKIPPWLEQTSKRALSRAENFVNEPYRRYEDRRIAPLSENEQSGIRLAGESVGSYKPYFDKATSYLDRAGQGFGGFDQETYVNPYMKAAIDPAARELGEDFDRRRRYLQDTAVSRGAFGGDRQTLMESEADRAYKESLGDLYSRGLASAYESGADRYMQDLGRYGQIGSQFGALGQAAHQMTGQDIGRLMRTGATERQVDQAERDFDYQQFVEDRDWEFSRFPMLLQALGMVPHSIEETSTSETSTSASPLSMLSQVAGAITSAVGAFGGGGADAGAFGAGNINISSPAATEAVSSGALEIPDWSNDPWG